MNNKGEQLVKKYTKKIKKRPSEYKDLGSEC